MKVPTLPGLPSGIGRRRRSVPVGARAGARRVAQALVTVLGATVLAWVLLPLAPGNPARRYLEAHQVTAPTAAQVSAAQHQLGLDRPLPTQYLIWLGRVVRGDLSTSYVSGLPVSHELATRFPATLRLAAATIVIALALAIPAGLVGALFAGRLPDTLTRLAAAVGAAVPSFVIGLALLYVVVLRFGIGVVVSDGHGSEVLMPALALAPLAAARWSRLLRAGLIDALESDYASVARARGVGRARIALVHALPNAAIPLLTAVMLTTGYLIAGDVVVETVFSWPGVGQYLAQSVANRDLPVIQGYVLIVAVSWVILSMAVDLVVGVLDPRARRSSR